MMTHEPARAMDALFDGDEVREVLREAFYTPAPAKKPLVKANGKQKAKGEAEAVALRGHLHLHVPR
jgi:hypothetical protein